MSVFDDERDAGVPLPARAPAPEEAHAAAVIRLLAAATSLEAAVDRLASLQDAGSLVEDLDLAAAWPNAARSLWQKESWTEAIQVDNPYAVMLEVRGSRDGGGPIVMRVPAAATRVLTVRVRDLSLRALAQPAGAIPATLVRFDRPMPNGVYPYGQTTSTAVVGNLAEGVADDGSGVVKVGTVYHAVPPTYADGQRAALEVDLRGSLASVLRAGNSNSFISSSLSDAFNPGNALAVAAMQYLYTGNGLFSWLRGPVVFKNIVPTLLTANTPLAIWTPASGKKFRLLGWDLASNAATVFSFTVAGALFRQLTQTASSTQVSTPAGYGNGDLANAANDVLQINASVGVTVSGFVFGTEE